MSDDALRRLARAAGLYVDWTDANGRPHEVKPDTLRAVLAALGHPAETTAAIVGLPGNVFRVPCRAGNETHKE